MRDYSDLGDLNALNASMLLSTVDWSRLHRSKSAERRNLAVLERDHFVIVMVNNNVDLIVESE